MTSTETVTAPDRVDPSRVAFNTGWSFRTKVTAFQELGGAGATGWTEVLLPHDALIGTERSADAPRGDTTAYFAGGSFEYRKTFTVPAEARGSRMLLEFDGVYRDAMVYVNGALAGQHAFGTSRFAVRIDPYVDFGAENEVRVECRTHLDSRWYAGAGIHRDVHLITKAPLHIAHDGVRVTTPDVDADRAIVEVAVTVENDGPVTATVRLSAAVVEEDIAEVASGSTPVTLLPGERQVARLRLPVPSPALWSVEDPSLYALRLQLTEVGRADVADGPIDEERVSFGIRTLQLDPQKGLRINGREVKLRGACIHSDNGPLGAVSIARAEERRVQALKDAGFNAIRSAHNPASSALLAACDRLGMLVMDESFDMWTSGKSDFDTASDFSQWWERDLEALVAKDFNHPSVIMYSIGNEIPETGNRFGAAIGRRLAEKIRSLDDTRYITNGINGFVSMLDTIIPMMQANRAAAADAGPAGVNGMMAGFGQMMSRIQASPQATERVEESFAVLDIAGMNYGDARYELDRELFPNRIIVGAETWPTDIDKNWALVTANSHVLGDFTWTGWDYLGETGIGVVKYADDGARGQASFATGFPGLTAWCGDLDITGFRRPASYYREIVFGLRSEPYIAVQRPEHHGKDIAVATPWAWTDSIGSWSWAGFEGRPIHVEVYADADEVELRLDGAPLGRATVGESRKFRADFETVYRPGELVAVAYRDGVETGRTALAAASEAFDLRVLADRTSLRADGTDLAYLAIELTDEHGTVHATHDRTVTVTVVGPAVLALGSGAPITEEGFTAPQHRTFDGRALAIVRPTGAGEITVTVTADGCAPASVALSVD
ncbi:Glycosyl hydrolases family 2, sugar binding domain [Agromyces sp. CF514]|uniref:glycoside hydrolase family 2 TIM barrel-domain containing protein n=1 Tax=Agromyces sp. CF514 TaxID=1881031 RepID=UPI0008E37007|nr:glycoside hydrolase family 2 TIM barrel-domain containing protein [Agromyces sp. CF514]SFR84512.1 Glycosyl hydrolases family 2, sugar binding domain [Agromyces sp. CF514]